MKIANPELNNCLTKLNNTKLTHYEKVSININCIARFLQLDVRTNQRSWLG